MIDLIDITKSYTMGETISTVLRGITFSIKKGEMIAIIGASGSGKSTLMHILGLLDRPSTGNYFLFDENVELLDDDQQATLRNSTFGFVFQQFFLLPRLTALQNVILPLQYREEKVVDAENRALEMLDKVGIKQRAYHKPNQLSGGQQQRVAIARALINDPAVILADEPTGALDTHTGSEIMKLFLSLNKEGRTVIIITHDPDIAQQCKRIIHIRDGLLI